ncbi:MAG TPA: DUF3761 domain-containing protein [Candidatus Udaeobacter sp.]|nr:DUF3761 domain-containing protein [Candidatus Udaeobacter sp.]
MKNVRKILILPLLAIVLLGAGCENQNSSQMNSFSKVNSPIINIRVKEEIPKLAPADDLKQVESQTTDYAPNGTYKNTAGNKVPRPYEAPSVPIGASAKCRDGSYSFSQNRRGTCSHHGGVAQWY